MKKVFKVKDHSKVGAREINENSSQNQNKSSVIAHEKTNDEADSNNASKDKKIEDVGQIKKFFKKSNSLVLQLNNLKAEFRDFKEEIRDAIRK